MHPYGVDPHHHGMPTETDVDLVIQVTPSKRRRSRGKLADVELHFVGRSPLGGMKFIGFSIWESGAAGDLVVKFPARTLRSEASVGAFPVQANRRRDGAGCHMGPYP